MKHVVNFNNISLEFRYWHRLAAYYAPINSKLQHPPPPQHDSRGFIGSQKHMVFFSISQNKQVSILIKRQSYCYRQSFCYIINPSLTKLVRSRWLDISRGVFSVFMDRDEPHAWLIKHIHSTLKCLPRGGVVKWIMHSDLLRQNRMLLRY